MRRRRESFGAYLFLVPALALFGIFVFFPLIKTAYFGFFASPLYAGQPSKFVGLSQYTSVLGSSDFLGALWRTVVFVLLTVPIGIALGLALAVLAHKKLAGIKIFRTIFSSTVATSAAVASVMSLTLLDPEVGLIPYWTGQHGGQSIFQNATWALPAVALVTTWQSLGFTFILMSAALQSVPDELHEAAAVDGSGPTANFWRITFPLLSPTMFFAAVIGIVSGFQTFGQIDILTQGGPINHTQVLIYDIYQTAFGFSTTADPGRASVMAIALFVILLLLTISQFTFSRRWVFYGDTRD